MTQVQTMKIYGFVTIGIWVLMWILYRRQLSMELSSNNLIILRSDFVDMLIDKVSLKFSIRKHTHQTMLEGEFTDSRYQWRQPVVHLCRYNQFNTCLRWSNFNQVLITKQHARNDRNIMCYDVSTKYDTVKNRPVPDYLLPTTCFRTNKVWFSGAASSIMNKLFTSSKDDIEMKENYYYLLSSNTAIYVPHEVPVNVEIDYFHQKMCLKPKIFNQIDVDESNYSQFEKHQYQSIYLNLTVCNSNRNMNHVHRYMMSRYIMKPHSLPHLELMTSPLWTTQSLLGSHSRSTLNGFINEIKRYKLNGIKCRLTVDEINYDIEDEGIDTEKLSPGNGDLDIFKQCSVSLAVSPFVNLESQSYKNGKSHGLFIKSADSDDPVLIRKDDKWFAYIDFTKHEAQTWFLESLIEMSRKYKIVGFKAVRYGLNPPGHTFQNLPNPQLYWTKFVETISHFEGLITSEVFYRNQNSHIFIHSRALSGNWGTSGIKSVVANILKQGLLGYPFVIPGVIGGVRSSEKLPQRDLYIRWLQLSAYLPVMQFSIPPWSYDEKVVNLANKYIKIHEKRVYPELKKAAQQAIKDGSPLIRPVWWNSTPRNNQYDIIHEFLIGNDLLVVPVLTQLPEIRYLYIPDGLWKNDLNGRKYRGPKTYNYKYHIPIDEILTFTRIIL